MPRALLPSLLSLSEGGIPPRFLVGWGSRGTLYIPPLRPRRVSNLRWESAFLSSQNQSHRKIELVCCQCHTRTFNTKTDCRECGAPLATSYTLLPQQWPLLGVPQQVLQQFETARTQATSVSGNMPNGPVAPPPPPTAQASTMPLPAGHQVGMPHVVPLHAPLTGFSRPQLLTEISAIEKYLKDTEGTTSAHRNALQATLQACRHELASRKSTGKRLDDAEARLRASQDATKAAETRLEEARAALTTSEQALAVAKQQEQRDTEALQAVKATMQELPAGTPTVLPDTITSMLLTLAARAGLEATQLSTLAMLLGRKPEQSDAAKAPPPTSDGGRPPGSRHAAGPCTPRCSFGGWCSSTHSTEKGSLRARCPLEHAARQHGRSLVGVGSVTTSPPPRAQPAAPCQRGRCLCPGSCVGGHSPDFAAVHPGCLLVCGSMPASCVPSVPVAQLCVHFSKKMLSHAPSHLVTCEPSLSLCNLWSMPRCTACTRSCTAICMSPPWCLLSAGRLCFSLALLPYVLALTQSTQVPPCCCYLLLMFSRAHSRFHIHLSCFCSPLLSVS